MTARLTPPARALAIALAALALEVVVILPFADHLADTNNTVHFTQHGLIFLGGVMMGFALRELRGARR
jgi:hypothetical protein